MNLPSSKAEWAEYGWGVVSVGVEDEPMDRAEVARRLACVLEDPNWRPPVLPEVAAQLVELTRRPTASLADAALLLSRDPMLAAQLMRRANSAVSAARPVQTVRDAAVRLGLHGVRNLALEIALSAKIFRAEGYQDIAEALRRRSVATAYLASAVCRLTSVSAAEAFLCALLADVGLSVGLMVLGERTRGVRRPDLSLVWPSLIEIHEQFSAKMATRWNLAPETALVLAHHHQLLVDGDAHPTIAVVMVAEWLTERLGVPFPSPPDATSVPRVSFVSQARETLGLTDRHIDALLRDGQKTLQELGY